MSTYAFACEKDHAPITFEVMADNDDAAMQMMVEKVRPHIQKLHAAQGMPPDEAVMDVIKQGWKKTPR